MSDERTRSAAADGGVGGEATGEGSTTPRRTTAGGCATEVAGRGKPAAHREPVQLAAFAVGAEHYALDIMRIKEIINPLPITRIPKAPAFIEGVIELRGAILPIVDLRKRFDVPAGPVQRGTKYVIVAMEGVGERWIVGLIVDRVLEVVRIPREDLRPAPAATFGEATRYFSGVCRHRDRIVMVIDLDAILSGSERVSLAGMGESPLLASSADAEVGRAPAAAAGGVVAEKTREPAPPGARER